MTSTSENLREFYRFIWKESEGWVYLPSKTKDGLWEERFYAWPKNEDQVVSATLLGSANGSEVYYSPALYSRRIAKKEHVIGAHVLWADFDGNAPTEWASAVAGIPAPSLRVQSSTPGHEHTYWALDSLLTDVATLENRNRTITVTAGADTSGWDATQLLRPPYTTNYGYSKPDRGGKKYDVTVEELSQREYTITDFNETKNFVPLMESALGDIPPLQAVLANLSWPKAFLPLFDKTAEDLEPKNGERGKRSDALMQLAYITAEAGGTDEQIFAIVSDANDRWGRYPLSRSDYRRRLVDIVERARAKHPLGEADFSGLTGYTDKPTAPLVYGFADFLAADIVVEWLFEGILAIKGFGVIFGPPGVGKTQFGIRMAMAIALGRSYLDWTNRLGRVAKVMMLSLEMNHPSLDYFLNIMKDDIAPADMAALQENFLIYPASQEVPFDTPEGKKFLESLLEQYKPEVLFIDSLSKAVFGPLTDEVVRELQRYLARLRSRYGVSIYFIHHDRKEQGKKRPAGEVDDMYGSRYISADADFVVGINKLDDFGNLLVTYSKLRLGPPRESFGIKRTDALNFMEIDLNDILEGTGRKGGPLAPGGFGGVFDPGSSN